MTVIAPRVEERAALQRSDGRGQLAVASRAGATHLAHLYQRDPCRFLFPAVEPDEIFTAVQITTSGGLAGGDRLRLEIVVGEDARLLVTAQAAEKVYRSLGPATEVAVNLHAGAGAWLEYLPQETILFDGARFKRHNMVEVAAGARVMVGEIVVFGRTARGEAFTQGLLHDRWSMRVDNRLVWADALRLDGDIAALLRQPAGFNGALAQATLIYVGADAAERLDQCRQLANDAANVTAGASRIGPVIVARLLADDAQALRRAVGCYWAALRHAAAGLPAVLPRLWHC